MTRPTRPLDIRLRDWRAGYTAGLAAPDSATPVRDPRMPYDRGYAEGWLARRLGLVTRSGADLTRLENAAPEGRRD